jgi:hypothetical protein
MLMYAEGNDMPGFHGQFDLFDNVIPHLEDMRHNMFRWKRVGDAVLLLSLFGAIGETRSYLMLRRCGAQRDRQREQDIANIWKVAAPPWANIDREFAERCVINGGCWMAADAWDDERIRNMERIINHVFDETRRLLVTWPVDQSEHRWLFKRYDFGERNLF